MDKHLNQLTVKVNDYELAFLKKRLEVEDVSMSETFREALHFFISHKNRQYEQLKELMGALPDISEHSE